MLKRHPRSIITYILLLALILPCMATQVSAAYENTYKNTGNMADDIIEVALTQVGYEEGSNNYTKYGVWYGQPNSPWCAMFVSWCAKEAEIPTTILKRTGMANPEHFGLSYKDGENYTPQKGDLFFKKNFNHVGLVYYTEGEYFYTVEGNTSTTSSEGTSVMIRRRKISEFYFSTPEYEGSSSSGCDHSYTKKYDSAHPHKEYKICTKCNRKSYTGNTSSQDSCKTCIQAACSHTFESWVNNSDSKHSRICTKCEKTESSSHNWKDIETVKEATCKENGEKKVICSVCNTTTTKLIPATGQHTYSDFSYIDAETHQKVCSGCGDTTTAKHTIDTNWSADPLYHWTSCSDCSGRIHQAEHIFEDGCLSPCSLCNYTSESGHRLSDTYLYNDQNHWQVCMRCEQSANLQAHHYSADCDTTCNDCGYTRNVTTAHKDSYASNEAGHWNVCSVCQRATDIISHTPDSNSQAWDTMTCIQCQHILRTSSQHEHTFHTAEYDENVHWGECICGEILEAEVHSWNVQTGTCSVCNAEFAEPENHGPFYFLVVIWNYLLSLTKFIK